MGLFDDDGKQKTTRPKRNSSQKTTTEREESKTNRSDKAVNKSNKGLSREERMIIIDAWAVVKRHGNGVMKAMYRKLVERI